MMAGMSRGTSLTTSGSTSLSLIGLSSCSSGGAPIGMKEMLSSPPCCRARRVTKARRLSGFRRSCGVGDKGMREAQHLAEHDSVGVPDPIAMPALMVRLDVSWGEVRQLVANAWESMS